MARIAYLDAADVPAEFHDLLGRGINLNRALINSPKGTRAFWALANYIRHGSRLDTRLRQLAILQIGWVARQPYEWSHHIKHGYDFGVSDADIAGLIADSEGRENTLDADTRMVLKAAREMFAGPGASAETVAALGRFLDSECLTDLVVAIGFYVGVVRVLDTLQIDVEPDYVQYLEKYPLPG